jgi:hypothetical protein
MNTLRNLSEPFRFGVLTALGRSPSAYNIFARQFGSRPETLVRPDTRLCIEAPPGSGNSFFVQAFSLANPGLAIAHHHHMSAQVAAAVKWNVPTLVILRDPIDCVLARVPDLTELRMIGPNLRMWLSFWAKVGGLLDRIALVRFEDMVARPEATIDLINDTFSTAFNSALPPAEAVFEVMHEHRRASTSPDGMANLHPNVPDPAKAARKREVRPHAVAHRLAAPAQEMYRLLLARYS